MRQQQAVLANHNEPMEERKLTGIVKRIFPVRGYVWIAGEDGVDYFGHQTHFQNGVKISSTWVGQPCEFIPKLNPEKDNAPYATSITIMVS
jgi:hypothetical protein